MKPATIRRFSIVEIALHWVNAVLYMSLFITGLLILLKHIFGIETALAVSLSLIHRAAGISLISILTLTIISSIFVKGFRHLWNSFIKCLTWKLSDIAWLIKVPFNMLHHRLILPPSERFNPGQKLHLLAIFLMLSGFSLSGIVMIIAPGALIAWVIHLIFFIPAALFLLLHLFLSLINPSTRKSLPAIFTGFISTEYANQHHRLWTESKESQPHDSYVSWKAFAITGLAAAILLTLLYIHNDRHILQSIREIILQRWTVSMLPGPLARSHAASPKAKYCTACHKSFLTSSPKACLSCHKLIKQRMEKQSGFHGKMKGQCSNCHPEHMGEDADIRNFDTIQFDHDMANFKLKGKHLWLACLECHLVESDDNKAVKTKYIGLNFEKCSDCHNDPHPGRFEQACTACHLENGWKEPNIIFSHKKGSQFAIDQIDSDTECAYCHKDIERLSYGTANTISSKPDPHTGRVGCRKCHYVDNQKPQDYANKCKSCHNEKYEQLYYDWNKVFDASALHNEKLLLKLSDENAPQSTQLTEKIKEAKKTGFHNIELANKLWDNILPNL